MNKNKYKLQSHKNRVYSPVVRLINPSLYQVVIPKNAPVIKTDKQAQDKFKYPPC